MFAAGNNGGKGASTLSIQAAAKNIIAVGASESAFPIVGSNGQNIGNVAYFSSQGPAYDQRIKPDIISPGYPIMSAKSNGLAGPSCQTLSMSGTSMASPGAAGVGLLIRQYFTDATNTFWSLLCNKAYHSCNPFEPSGVLVKAVLLHSGTQMLSWAGKVALGAPPDYSQGYGRVTLKNVLPLHNVYTFDLFVDDLVNIAPYTTIRYTILLGAYATSVPIKVTLAWYDPPNVDGTTTPALLQNLDLTVTSPAKKIYRGNGKGTADVVNTNEQVYIAQPTAGLWKIDISSQALPVSGSQQFSVVITSAGPVSYA